MSFNEKIYMAIGNVSDEKIAEADSDKLEKSKTVITTFRMRLIVSAAAVCLLVAGLVYAIPLFSSQPPVDYDLTDTSILGLPVDDFCLGDVQSGVMADRHVYHELHDFFTYNSPRAFAFVRVLDTRLVQEGREGYITRQISTVQVLANVWDNGDEVPQIIEVNQYSYNFDGYNAIFLRRGGVYLLALDCFDWEGSDWWNIMGDNDVLFEVDDKGLIWSHSRYYGFNQFDGETAGVVAEAFLDITADANFDILISNFGKTLRFGYDLAEITVLSVAEIDDEMYRYTLDSPVFGEFTAVSWGREQGYFEVGERYLAFLFPTEEVADGIGIWSFYSAMVNDDDTIAGDGDSVFAEFNGFTVEKMFELAELIG
ncbi:MAG: hypothetical protein FWD34_02870 [Oscillospiraceae bacterium]|nr:hypothetical protein [Oscillospiraceae bacterium]